MGNFSGKLNAIFCLEFTIFVSFINYVTKTLSEPNLSSPSNNYFALNNLNFLSGLLDSSNLTCTKSSRTIRANNDSIFTLNTNKNSNFNYP